MDDKQQRYEKIAFLGEGQVRNKILIHELHLPTQ